MKIEQTYETFGIEVKRFYLPFILTQVCPKCGKVLERDLNDQYLSYPTCGKPEEITFY